jgi:hypothetical protein
VNLYPVRVHLTAIAPNPKTPNNFDVAYFTKMFSVPPGTDEIVEILSNGVEIYINLSGRFSWYPQVEIFQCHDRVSFDGFELKEVRWNLGALGWQETL